MKSIALAHALVSTSALAAGDIVMHRNLGCGCCEKWAIQVRQKFGRTVHKIETYLAQPHIEVEVK